MPLKLGEFLKRAHLKGRIASAYLITGKGEREKLRLAGEFAKGLLCENNEPFGCNNCRSCRRVSTFLEDILKGNVESYAYHYETEEGKKRFAYLIGEHPDLAVVVPDGKQIKIDQIREIKEFVSLKPTGRHKVVIFTDFEKANVHAQNAFLKILEEPPSGVVFLLLAENERGILPTIVSRCQVLHRPPLGEEELQELLKRAGDIPPFLRELIRTDRSERFLDLANREETLKVLEVLLKRDRTFSEILEAAEIFEKFPEETQNLLLTAFEVYLPKLELSPDEMEKKFKLLKEIKKGLPRGIKGKLALECLMLS